MSRAFRHTAIYVRRDRIRTAADLRGKRVGVPEYQLSANVWARALLKEDFGILPRDVTWVRGGIETPGRAEKLKVQLPPEVKIEQAPETDTLAAMLDRGELDAFIGPAPPSCFGRNPEVQWLYPDPTAAAQDYYRRTGIFPIMHVLGVRKELAAQHPWLPVALYKAFDAAKNIALERLADPSAPKTSLPFLEEQITAAQRLMGRDYWPNGVAANRSTLDAFLAHHHDQGLSQRRVLGRRTVRPDHLRAGQDLAGTKFARLASAGAGARLAAVVRPLPRCDPVAPKRPCAVPPPSCPLTPFPPPPPWSKTSSPPTTSCSTRAWSTPSATSACATTSDPNRFLLARNMAPGQVTAGDILQYALDGTPLDAGGRRVYLERFIHGAIYRARPDVMAVVHSHSPAIVPFSVTRKARAAAGLPHERLPRCRRAAVRDPRHGRRCTDLLIRDDRLGRALADSARLGQLRADARPRLDHRRRRR